MSHDGSREMEAAAVLKLFQQLRIDEELEPPPGFYGRVLDRIAVERQSIWVPFINSPLAPGALIACVVFACSVLLFFVHAETPGKSDDLVAALTSGSAADQRDAVLSEFLAYPLPNQPAQ